MILKKRTVPYTVLALAAAAALTACDDGSGKNSSSKPAAKPTATATAKQELTQEEISKAAGLPPKPTGAKRQQLLDALRKAAPDVVRYEDKAIDAARNQCSAINNGAKRLDWSASQRFTYKDVTTTETQGKAINAALKDSGFCKV